MFSRSTSAMWTGISARHPMQSLASTRNRALKEAKDMALTDRKIELRPDIELQRVIPLNRPPRSAAHPRQLSQPHHQAQPAPRRRSPVRRPAHRSAGGRVKVDAKAARAAPAIAEHDPHVEQFPDRLSVTLTSAFADRSSRRRHAGRPRVRDRGGAMTASAILSTTVHKRRRRTKAEIGRMRQVTLTSSAATIRSPSGTSSTA